MEDTQGAVVSNDARAIGDWQGEWTSEDGKLSCTFGPPPASAFISDTIDEALGPKQAGNQNLWMKYYALASIRSWTGPKPSAPEILVTSSVDAGTLVRPQNDDQFRVARKRFENEDNYMSYVAAYWRRTSPQFAQMVSDSEAANFTPEQLEARSREAANAQLKN